MDLPRVPSQALVEAEARMRRSRKRIVAISTTVGLATVSILGAYARPHGGHPPPAMPWIVLAVFGALVANVILTRMALSRTRRPRCSACGELVAVDPNWKMDRASTCPACGRRTTVVGRP